MMTLLFTLGLLNGFSLGVFLNENNGKLSPIQIALFILMIFVGIFVLLGFMVFHWYNDWKRK